MGSPDDLDWKEGRLDYDVGHYERRYIRLV